MKTDTDLNDDAGGLIEKPAYKKPELTILSTRSTESGTVDAPFESPPFTLVS
jgi:hypothetical protein